MISEDAKSRPEHDCLRRKKQAGVMISEDAKSRPEACKQG